MPPHRPELGPCHEWSGPAKEDGYVKIRWKGKQNVYIHRIAWQLAKGPIKKGLLICHSCDNRKCVRVSHLFAGTHAQNSKDMVEKGRQGSLCGESVGTSILNEQKVKAIRAEYKDGLTQVQLAKKYGVQQMTVSKIVRRVTWAHVA